ncbi:hypothetical protein RV17_GL001765 [Enterococcus thailandicus]|nr:hypothetical protein RV17_GL001765 [Enterococcus thailandicus]
MLKKRFFDKFYCLSNLSKQYEKEFFFVLVGRDLLHSLQ